MITRIQRIKRKVLGYLSFSTALFVFQACYGPPQDMNDDTYIQGYVKSQKSNLPIPGIKVSVDASTYSVLTDENGFFELYSPVTDNYKILFEDIDDQENGKFLGKDTLLEGSDSEYYLNEVLLEEI
ncbi:MAG: hypothetical protein JXB49_35190 [Bacteroidales bacterium]|nr:hypothetical protein [Bacteroidales bacterium]